MNKTESGIISASGEQKFICVRFKAQGDSKWTNGRGRLDGLQHCKEFCNRLTWNQYKHKLENCGLEGYESCLKETTLSYKCFNDDVEWCNVTTNHPTAFDIDICGDDMVASLKFKKGDHEYSRNVKLRNAGECEEESTLQETIWIVIGIIIGVFCSSACSDTK